MNRINFELFKSNVCHQVKEQGDIDFLIATLESNAIRDYYNRQWYRESFYLLAMIDYLSRENQIPLCSDYDDLRCQKLQEPQYPASVLVTASVMDCSDVKEQVLAQAIPEFLRHNIVENDLRNVI